ncbi:hypothetical protein CA2015_3949 [Cyclobacterium amurskyense]|uniref:Uncharacterized protein n=1 Tax=Cyclobacterium amurskyense TaxID=320787 RepID=A0A0H4PY12_9BACT|nr:hypothetical protein CA2015_3949 [Cyclobacterium amurskyense]
MTWFRQAQPPESYRHLSLSKATVSMKTSTILHDVVSTGSTTVNVPPPEPVEGNDINENKNDIT